MFVLFNNLFFQFQIKSWIIYYLKKFYIYSLFIDAFWNFFDYLLFVLFGGVFVVSIHFCYALFWYTLLSGFFFKLLSFLCIFHFILFSLFLFKIFLHFYIFIENFPFFYIYFIKWVRNFLNFFASFFVIDIFLGFSFLLLYLLHIYYSFCFSLNALCCIHFFRFFFAPHGRMTDGENSILLVAATLSFQQTWKKNTTHLHTIATQQ